MVYRCGPTLSWSRTIALMAIFCASSACVYKQSVAITPNLSAIAVEHPTNFILGICAGIKDGRPAFDKIPTVGVQSIRLDAPWKEIERSPGQYSIPDFVDDTVKSALKMHLIPLVILDYGNPLYGDDKPTTPQAIEAFAHYAAFVVSHFKGQVQLFELENEWETHTGATTPGTPEAVYRVGETGLPGHQAGKPPIVSCCRGALRI